MILFNTIRIAAESSVWRIHGQRSLVSYSPWDLKESDTAEHAHTHTPGELVFWVSVKPARRGS